MSSFTSTSSEPTALLLNTPIPTPTYGSFGIFTVKTSLHIAAPARDLIAIVTSPETYSKWCNFTARVAITSFEKPATATSLWTESQIQPGANFEQIVFMNGGGVAQYLKSGTKGSTKNMCQCTVFDEDLGEGRKGYRVCWKATSYPGWLLRSERVQEYVVSGVDGQETEVVGWETFGGPLAYLVKWFVGTTLVERLGEFGSDLKSFAEAGGKAK